MVALLIIVLLVYLLYKHNIKNYDKWETSRIPFIKPYPMVGSYAPLVLKSKSFSDLIADIYKHFKIQGVRVGGFFEFTRPVLMILDPQIQKLIMVKEFDAFSNRRNLANIDDVFVKALINLQETNRRWTVNAAMDRVATRRYVIPAQNGQPEVVIEKGDMVYFPVIGLHLDPDYFPNPLKFDPERFSSENKKYMTPFSFSPFGHGPRACIGMRFALMQSKTCLVHLVRNFHLVVISKTDISPQYKKGALLPITENGIWIGFKPR